MTKSALADFVSASSLITETWSSGDNGFHHPVVPQGSGPLAYSRIKGTNRTGTMIVVVAVPSACLTNTMSC